MMKLKPGFEQQMKELLGSDYGKYVKALDKRYLNSVRCNTLKISPKDLVERLSKKWKVLQPFDSYPEIIVIDQQLEPGEIGKALEYMLGYYYVQEISSMMPVIALGVKGDESVLDLAAAPGSKTTQLAAVMGNKGVLIANDVTLGRIRILSTNLQRCGVTNCIVTQHDGGNLCNRLLGKFEFDKILVDAPCSGEGTLRTNPKTASMFNENLIKKLSGIQKGLLRSALKVLKSGGVVVYSTCTHAPEENEEVVNEILQQGNVKIEDIKIPLKTRPGIVKWKDKKYHDDLKKCVRVYPQDNNTEGFFIARLRKK